MQIKKINEVYDHDVHNIIAGDFNFVTGESDRIRKDSARCTNNSLDKRNAETWNGAADSMKIQEFVQDAFTCENSYGWSRLDRAYTNLHVTDVCAMQCSCNLLDHPRHLSDHKPLSINIKMFKKKKGGKYVPRWIADHPSFLSELECEFDARCQDFERLRKRSPRPFDRLAVFKECVYTVAGYIQRSCKHVVANTIEHQLAVCMSFIRSIYMCNFEKARSLQGKCTTLGSIGIGDGTIFSAEFQTLKDTTAELMRTDIRDRSNELREARESLPEHLIAQKKNDIASRLKRMLPGGNVDIAAMVDSSGSVVTDDLGIADILNSHWQKVFARRPTNQTMRAQWLQEMRGKFKVGVDQLRPSRELIRKVIQNAHPSACGPDAIPFEVFKRSLSISVELFYDVANAMLDGDKPGDDFNLAYMICIPKAPDGKLEDGTSCYAAAGTRPLSIVDAANRILAAIFQCTLELAVASRISNAQKGFVKGRRMLRNVLEIDHAAQKISVTNKSGAILLFDFTAAFPSLAHDMMWDVLRFGGIDESFIEVVRMFYANNQHILKVRGGLFKGVQVLSGVRQGCPLSGLLFAICIDVLLCKIDKLLSGDETIGAFADDIAVVVSNIWTSASSLQVLFEEFEDISALSLNVKKTIMIPLWQITRQQTVSRLLRELCPAWRDLAIDLKGKYLGFWIGPDAMTERWKRPLAKFEQRVLQWARMHLGLSLNVIAFNMYIAPVLEFVAQLCETDIHVHAVIAWALRRLASGPGTWVTRLDLENLTFFGFQQEFRTLENTAKAAKLRVANDIAADCGYKCEELRRKQADGWLRPFGSWHNHSMYKILQNNKMSMAEKGITISGIKGLAKCSRRVQKKTRFQSAARHAIKTKLEPFDGEERIRRKMMRWKLTGPPAHVARRIASRFSVLKANCRPCVVAAFFRTLWNGWPTSARMRSLDGAGGVRRCVFGCTAAEDRLEHYLTCKVIWNVLESPQGLGMMPAQRTLNHMLLAERGLSERDITAVAVACYAIGRTAHVCKSAPNELNVASVLKLFIKEATRGSKASQILNIAKSNLLHQSV
jgi:hypothetical protein